MQLNLKEIRAIAKMVQEKGLDQVVVESTDADAPVCRLQLRKFHEPVFAVAAPESDLQTYDAPEHLATHLLVVTSPTVGMFRFGNSPIKKGQQVHDLQVIGVVESLKVPNEVRLTNSGIVESVLVEDGQGVEFGQPLIEVQIDG
ncbi:MAG: biotin/lipoyl-containing protein [Abditibacteriaceae bacterium]